MLWLAAVCLAARGVFAADQATGFVDRVYRDAEGEHKYVVFVPKDYSADRQWPVILFLHGAGERGNDGRRQVEVGLGPAVRERADTFPFLVVFPQNEDVKGRILNSWSPDEPNGKRALAILERVERDYRIDPRRRILTGWSMGGYGAWAMGAALPTHWAAVVPLSGGGDPQTAAKLKDVPVWAFHGALDNAVLPAESRRMVEALKAAGGRPRYDEIAEAGHDVWKIVYDQDALYAWMLNPAAADAASVPLRVAPGRKVPARPAEDQPFLPAVEILGAGSLRLGNGMLQTLSYSIPHQVSADFLRGSVEDIYTSTTAEGLYFTVAFTNIRYAADLARVHLSGYADNRLSVQLAVENARMTIGSTYVSGSGRSASAGPIDIVVGHRAPVWLSIGAEPYIEDRRLKLRPVAVRFQIPSNNWYVSSPAGVSARGLGMTRERVAQGLVSGLYGRKSLIESKVEQLAPRILQQLERQLDLSRTAELVEQFWPLPVYQPRVRVWPHDIRTDAGGVSLVFGVTAAAVEPKAAPKTPRQINLTALRAADVPTAPNLLMGMAPAILQPLSELLIQSDVARVHVGDLPDGSFAPFADRETLAQILPDIRSLPAQTEIWSELILAEPLTASQPLTPRLAAEDGGNGGPSTEEQGGTLLQLHAPKVLISLAIKTNPQAVEWTPYAEFQFDLRQSIRATVVKPAYDVRVMRIDWTGRPHIEAAARFSPDYKPRDAAAHAERLGELFEQCWTALAGTRKMVEHSIPDVDFGYSKLRIDEVSWTPPQLLFGFVPPGVKLTNSANERLVYETKGPFSGWGGPFTLEPGQSHEYEISYPLLYRRRIDGRYVMYTLPVGSHSEYRVPLTGGPPQLFKARN